MSASQEVVCYAGEALALPFAMVDGTDITGWTLAFTLRSAAGSVLFTRPMPSPATFSLSSADTDRPASAGYAWDIWRTDTGAEACLAHGSLLILRRVRA